MQGIGQLQFSIPPNSYSGFYIFYDDKRELNAVQGTKIKPDIVENYNNFEIMEDKENFIRDILTQKQHTEN